MEAHLLQCLLCVCDIGESHTVPLFVISVIVHNTLMSFVFSC